jgi:nitrate/TMAO reductase-like tetraheme cytochrome c subunit
MYPSHEPQHPGQRPTTRGEPMRYVAIFFVVAVIGMFGYLVAESKMLSYMSSDPEVCINCHTMNTCSKVSSFR